MSSPPSVQLLTKAHVGNEADAGIQDTIQYTYVDVEVLEVHTCLPVVLSNE